MRLASKIDSVYSVLILNGIKDNAEPSNLKMATGFKRKADDNRIMELNSIGMSMTGIAELLGVHHTTITYRLKALGIAPMDTRRAFMEDVFNTLPSSQQDWLISQLGPGYTIKDMVRSLITREFVNRSKSTAVL